MPNFGPLSSISIACKCYHLVNANEKVDIKYVFTRHLKELLVQAPKAKDM